MPRGWMNSPHFDQDKAFTEREAFIWSVENAAYVTHQHRFNDKMYEVVRGEFVTSHNRLAAEFRWSPKKVRTFIKHMVQAGRWAKRGAHEGAKAPTVITICNYDDFQAPVSTRGRSPDEVNGARGANARRKRGGVEKEESIKEGKKGNEVSYVDRSKVGEADVLEAIARWNEAAEASGWRTVTSPLALGRSTRLRTTLAEAGIDQWCQAIAKAQMSEWLAGRNPPPWFRFDFLLSADKLQNIIEGDFDKAFDNKKNAWAL